MTGQEEVLSVTLKKYIKCSFATATPTLAPAVASHRHVSGDGNQLSPDAPRGDGTRLPPGGSTPYVCRLRRRRDRHIAEEARRWAGASHVMHACVPEQESVFNV